MKLTNEELKEILLEDLYNFILEHEEIQIYHSLFGNNIVCVAVNEPLNENAYVTDKLGINNYLVGYKEALNYIIKGDKKWNIV